MNTDKKDPTYFFLKVDHPDWDRLLGNRDEVFLLLKAAAYAKFGKHKDRGKSIVPTPKGMDRYRKRKLLKRLEKHGYIKTERVKNETQCTLLEDSPASIADWRPDGERFLKVWRTEHLFDMLESENPALLLLIQEGFNAVRKPKNRVKKLRYSPDLKINQKEFKYAREYLHKKGLVPNKKLYIKGGHTLGTPGGHTLGIASLCELGICKSSFPNFRLFEENFRHFSADSSRIETQEGYQEDKHMKIPPPKPPKIQGGVFCSEEELGRSAEELINSPEYDVEIKVLRELPFLRDASKTLLTRVVSVYEMRMESAKYPIDWAYERIQWKAVYNPELEYGIVDQLTRQLTAKRFQIDWLHLQHLCTTNDIEARLETEEMQISRAVAEAYKDPAGWDVYIQQALEMTTQEAVKRMLMVYIQRDKTPYQALSLLYWLNKLGGRELAEWYRDKIRDCVSRWGPVHESALEILWSPNRIHEVAKKSEDLRKQLRTLELEEEERVYNQDLMRYEPKEI